jgi:16S rRNA (adenine1518-N6/adenine1519-N6)-dimethyltransferase
VLRDGTLNLLNKYGLRIDAALDEQQLIDPEVIKSLIDASRLEPNDTVMEIGPGAGNITVELVGRAKKVVAIEKNPKFVSLLRERLLGFSNVEIVEGDAMRVRLPTFDVVVSNLPYSLAEATLQRLAKTKFKAASLIVSSSFASILTAGQGTPRYSKLTYEVGLFFDSAKIIEVGREAFYPEPKTSTAIVVIKPKPIKKPSEAVLSALLHQGDKKTTNAMREALISSATHGYPTTKNGAKSVVARLAIPENILEKRVARLSLAEIQLLGERLDKFTS